MGNAIYRGRELGYPLTHGSSYGDYDVMYGPKVIDVKGAVVLDIGADEGSTADYFFQKGAARVIASELVPARLEKLHAWAKEEPRLTVVGPVTGPEDIADWLDMADGERLIVKMDADCGNGTPGEEGVLFGLTDTYLRIPEAWVIETHSPEVHKELMALFEKIGFTTRLVCQWRSNPLVKVFVANRG